MHGPVLDDDGGAKLQTEDLFVIEHPSFGAILDQIRDIIESKSSDEIEHAREYVPITQNPDDAACQLVDVRLARLEGTPILLDVAAQAALGEEKASSAGNTSPRMGITTSRSE